MSRLLDRLGVLSLIENDSLRPSRMNVRRWENGAVIGGMRTSEFESKYGSPYIQIHRAKLHAGLYKRAADIGVLFRVNCGVSNYDIQKPSLSTVNGETYEADLVIAADGLSMSSFHNVQSV